MYGRLTELTPNVYDGLVPIRKLQVQILPEPLEVEVLYVEAS